METAAVCVGVATIGAAFALSNLVVRHSLGRLGEKDRYLALVVLGLSFAAAGLLLFHVWLVAQVVCFWVLLFAFIWASLKLLTDKRETDDT